MQLNIIVQVQELFQRSLVNHGLGQSVLFEHETGTDQINPDGTTTTLTSFVQSYDVALQTDQGVGEYFFIYE
jgi:hypothetical protein